jgi:hypothetical protein
MKMRANVVKKWFNVDGEINVAGFIGHRACYLQVAGIKATVYAYDRILHSTTLPNGALQKKAKKLAAWLRELGFQRVN